MAGLEFAAQRRTVVGKKVRQLRRDGLVPGSSTAQSSKARSRSVSIAGIFSSSIRPTGIRRSSCSAGRTATSRSSFARCSRIRCAGSQFMSTSSRRTCACRCARSCRSPSTIRASRSTACSPRFAPRSRWRRCRPAFRTRSTSTSRSSAHPGDAIRVGDLNLPDGVTAVTDRRRDDRRRSKRSTRSRKRRPKRPRRQRRRKSRLVRNPTGAEAGE